jgi:hypothetical protein
LALPKTPERPMMIGGWPMAVTINQLRNGINYWRLEKFPSDFHNTFYERDLAALRANGVFNQEWWNRFFPVLKRWKATRNGPADNILTAQAQARFAALSRIWKPAVAPCLDNDIAGVEWHQIEAFPSLAAEIKGVRVSRPAPIKEKQRFVMTIGPSCALLVIASVLIAISAVGQNLETDATKAAGYVSQSKPLSNDDVIQMVSLGLGDGVIIAKIRAATTIFYTSIDGLKALKAAKVAHDSNSVPLSGRRLLARCPP